MNLFEPLRLKFEKPDWARNPEFGLLDTVLERHPELIKIAEADVLRGCLQSEFGRQDMPSVEQIVRAAIYKEMKGLDYRELESYIFMHRDVSLPFLFSFQRYLIVSECTILLQLCGYVRKMAVSLQYKMRQWKFMADR